MLKFSRTEPDLAYSEVIGRIATAGVKPEDQEFYVNLLCDLNFLGIETKDGFVFPDHEQERRMLREVAREGASQRNGADQDDRYLINSAFYDVLQIQ